MGCEPGGVRERQEGRGQDFTKESGRLWCNYMFLSQSPTIIFSYIKTISSASNKWWGLMCILYIYIFKISPFKIKERVFLRNFEHTFFFFFFGRQIL